MQLYHGSRHPSALDELQVQSYPQTKNGVTAQWLFATHRRDQGMAYTLPFVNGFMSTLSRSEDDTLGYFRAQTSEQFNNTALNGLLYDFAATGFVRVDNNGREWVRGAPLAIVKPPAQVSHVQEVLAEGVQVFTLAQGVAPDVLDRKSPAFLFRKGAIREEVAEILARPDSPLVWENARTGIVPDPQLQQLVQQRKAKLPACQ